MKISRRIPIVLTALIFAIMACNINASGPQQKVSLDEALTLIAQTVQAATQQAAAAGFRPAADCLR